MIADVSLGVFLFGGIDSSLVTALMQHNSGSPVRTFSVSISEKGNDEAGYAQSVANHLGTEHTEFYVTPEEVRDVIPALPCIFDEPIADPSQIPTYLVAKTAQPFIAPAASLLAPSPSDTLRRNA
jgi:asparagine synthase (glutamine-hydrolysing)